MTRLTGWRYGLVAGILFLLIGSCIQGFWSGRWAEVYRSLPIRAAIVIPVFMLIFSKLRARIRSHPQ
jgi:hypothetical protein